MVINIGKTPNIKLVKEYKWGITVDQAIIHSKHMKDSKAY